MKRMKPSKSNTKPTVRNWSSSRMSSSSSRRVWLSSRDRFRDSLRSKRCSFKLNIWSKTWRIPSRLPTPSSSTCCLTKWIWTSTWCFRSCLETAQLEKWLMSKLTPKRQIVRRWFCFRRYKRGSRRSCTSECSQRTIASRQHLISKLNWLN